MFKSQKQQMIEKKRRALNTKTCQLLLFAIAVISGIVSTKTIAEPHEYKISYKWNNVQINGGGYITGVVFSPSYKNEVYIRTDIGGAYRRNPENNVWVPLNDSLPREDQNLNGILSIALDPTDINKIYLAAGTYLNANNSKAAILISNDRGKSWDKSELPFWLGANEDGRGSGERLLVDAKNPQKIWLGTNVNGLWQSVDSAKSWRKIGFDNQHILFVLQAKNGAFFVSTTTGVYLSEDGGNSFNLIDNFPKDLIANQGKEGKNGEIFFTLADKIGPNDIKRGAVVKLSSQKNLEIISPVIGNNETFGFGGLGIDNETGLIAVSTNNKWASGDEIFVQSEDGNWRSINKDSSFDYSSTPWIKDYSHGNLTHIGHWISDLEIDPFDSNHAIYVTGYGIWETYSFNQTNIKWSFNNQGIEETAVLDLAIPSKKGSDNLQPKLLSALGDISGFSHFDLNDIKNNKMLLPFQGNSRSIDVASDIPDFVTRTTDKSPFGYFSTDGAKNWQAFSTFPTNAKYNGGKIRVSADAKTIAWIIDGVCYYSFDLGRRWSLSSGLSQDIKNAILISDKVDPQLFYIYDLPSGKLYKSSDGAKNFKLTKGKLTNWSNSVASVPYNPSHIWAATYNGLFASDNGGESFIKIEPFEASWAVSFGKPAPNADYPTIFVAGKMANLSGIFMSQDLGEKWLLISNKNMQFSSIRVLQGDPNIFGRVYVGTDGRGIFYGDIVLELNNQDKKQ